MGSGVFVCLFDLLLVFVCFSTFGVFVFQFLTPILKSMCLIQIL